MEAGHTLTVRVYRIMGHCPVYVEGQSFRIREGYVLEAELAGGICLHSLASILPYYVALSRGVHPSSLGLAGPKADCAYVHCLDPCEITGGGTVVFEIERE
ncbi:MAG: TIGR04076 family protein [candidate division KSB1 bacterium]|nr:TIGR04076 family protein [candidate division KSB1 bacterium]